MAARRGCARAGRLERKTIRRTIGDVRAWSIEAWILKQAGIKFDAKAEPSKLRVVAG